MAVLVDTPCNSVEFLTASMCDPQLQPCQRGIQAEIVLLLNVINHPITVRCYKTHGSDLNLYFREVLQGKCGREELDSPECEVAKFCVSWKL